MTKPTLRQLLALALLAAPVGCGGGGDDDATDPDTDPDTDVDAGTPVAAAAFPQGFAMASPTSSAGSNQRTNPTGGSVRRTRLGAETSYRQRVEELAAIANGTTAEQCEVVFGGLNLQGQGSPSCYGPKLNYHNHPDGEDVTPMGETVPTLPGGDLGIWSEKEGEDEACAAAKLNSLIGTLATRVDVGLYLAASTVCLMNVDGIALPEIGGNVDMSAALANALEALNPGLTIDAGTLERLDDEDDNPVYRYDFELTVTPSPPSPPPGPMLRWFAPAGPPPAGPTTVTISLQHVNTGTDSHHGKVWSTIQTSDTEASGYSVLYELGSSEAKMCARSADYRPNDPDPDPFDPDLFFDDAHNVSPAGTWTGNFSNAVFNLDPDDGTGDVSYAWQAGTGDSHTRVFNISTAPDSADGEPTEACAFFGYGDDVGGSLSNEISTFICNWAGPGNQRPGQEGYAQKQCMVRNDEGVFEPTDSAIEYAPVNSCSVDPDTTADDFEYKVSTDEDYSTDALTSALVPLTGDSADPDFASYSPPDCPDDFLATDP